MLQLDLTMSDRELSLSVAARCSEVGTVKSVKIHRHPKPFALIEMATHEQTFELAALHGRSAFGTSVLLYLEPVKKH